MLLNSNRKIFQKKLMTFNTQLATITRLPTKWNLVTSCILITTLLKKQNQEISFIKKETSRPNPTGRLSIQIKKVNLNGRHLPMIHSLSSPEILCTPAVLALKQIRWQLCLKISEIKIIIIFKVMAWFKTNWSGQRVQNQEKTITRPKEDQ